LRHVRPPVARLLGHVTRALTPTLVDVLLADAVSGPASSTTAELFGLELHMVGETWPASQVAREDLRP
jgi:hypothetical protein